MRCTTFIIFLSLAIFISCQNKSNKIKTDKELISNFMQNVIINAEMNYNDYINKSRVKYAKQMLLDKTFDNYTIESIGLESSFSSKSSFYAAFKKFTNQTPVQFKKDVRNL